MKRSAGISIIIGGFMLSMLFLSCTEKREDLILGSWELESFAVLTVVSDGRPDSDCIDSSLHGEIDFSKDGTGLLNREANDCFPQDLVDWPFDWTLDPEANTLMINTVTYSIETLNEDELVLRKDENHFARHIGFFEYVWLSRYKRN